MKNRGYQTCLSIRYTFYHIIAFGDYSFSTTVTLENGVPLETVQKMLGHKNIRTTQIYAKMTKRRIGADMSTLAQILGQGAQPAAQ